MKHDSLTVDHNEWYRFSGSKGGHPIYLLVTIRKERFVMQAYEERKKNTGEMHRDRKRHMDLATRVQMIRYLSLKHQSICFLF